MQLFSGSEIADIIARLGFTHVVWLPDSMLGQWESALESDRRFQLVRVCREGEAWPLAAGLQLGGQRPLVVIQVTGLFESGDALRNVLFDLKLPVYAILGARSWLIPDSRDSAKALTVPMLDVWKVPHVLVESPADREKLEAHLQHHSQQSTSAFVLVAEGRR